MKALMNDRDRSLRIFACACTCVLDYNLLGPYDIINDLFSFHIRLSNSQLSFNREHDVPRDNALASSSCRHILLRSAWEINAFSK